MKNLGAAHENLDHQAYLIITAAIEKAAEIDTKMDIAVVGAGVALTLDDAGTCTAARVAIGAVAPTALLVADAGAALVGTTVDDDAIGAMP